MRIILLLMVFAILYVTAVKAQVTGNNIYDNARRNYISGNFEEAIKYYNEYLKTTLQSLHGNHNP